MNFGRGPVIPCGDMHRSFTDAFVLIYVHTSSTSSVLSMFVEICNATVDGYAACLLTEEPTAQTHLNVHFVSSAFFRTYRLSKNFVDVGL